MDTIGAETLKRMKKVGFYNRWLVGTVKKYLSGEILEIGCGIGNMTEMLVNFGRVTAMDIDKYYIARTKKKLGKTVSVGFGDVEAGKFFFGNRKFDVVVSFNVLEHISDDDRAIRNMASKVKKNGKLIILTPAHKLLYGSLDRNLGHYRRYDKLELSRKFKNSGLEVVDVKYVNWLGAIGWFINSRILGRKILPSKQLGIFAKLSRPFLFLERFISPSFGLSVLIVGEKT